MLRVKELLTILLVLAFSVTSLAASSYNEAKYRQIEDNLLVGINTENRGLQISCAYFLGEMQSERAIIPLLKMLKSGETEEERIIAALSLAKIKSERGLFAIKQRIKFDDSERVQRLCEIFYTNHVVNELEGDIIVEPFHIVDLQSEFNGFKLADFSGK
jgi:HEAT repeat protein